MGFRNFVVVTARSLSVSGEVWNRADGAVEIAAEHADKSVLERFSLVVEHGPGYVRDVQIEPASELGLTEFSVGPTR